MVIFPHIIGLRFLNLTRRYGHFLKSTCNMETSKRKHTQQEPFLNINLTCDIEGLGGERGQRGLSDIDVSDVGSDMQYGDPSTKSPLI